MMKILILSLFLASAAHAEPTSSVGLVHLVADYFSNRPNCEKIKTYEDGCEHPDKKLRVSPWVSLLYQITCGSSVSCHSEAYSYRFDNHTLSAVAQLVSDPKFFTPTDCKDAAGKDAVKVMKACMARRLADWPTLTGQVRNYLNLPKRGRPDFSGETQEAAEPEATQ